MVVTFGHEILRKIFLVIDTSQLKRYTVTFTVWLAREFRASVVIAHVEEVSRVPPLGLQLPGMSQSGSRRERMEEIRRVKSQIAGAGIEIKTIYREGTKAATELSRLAQQRRSDLIIAESVGEVGGTAEGLIGKSHCPVLMVGPGADGEQVGRHALRSVVFLTDNSHASMAGAFYVFSLAKAFQAQLLVILNRAAGDNLAETEFLEQASATVDGVNWSRWQPADGVTGISALADTLASADLVVVSGQIVLDWEREKSLTLHELVQQAACPVMALPLVR
jgi:nucleotide-binding universal stress UspA family protein